MKLSLFKTSSIIKASMIGGLSLFLTAQAPANATANTKETIRVYAASSMTNVIEEIAQQFEKATHHDVVPIYGSSSSLARQIVRGAPASVYISANEKWMQYLVDQQVISKDAIATIATNQLALISTSKPDGQEQTFDITDLTQWQSQLQGERLAIGSPESVPVGIYAKQALNKLGIWQRVQSNIAPTKSARLVLALAERQEVPLAIVYATDAALSTKVQLVHQFSQELHDPIIYPAAAISNSSAATHFMEYLTSEEGQGVFHRYGFGQP